MSTFPAKIQEKITHYIQHLKTYNEHTNIYSKKAYDKLDFHIQDALTLAELIGSEPQEILDMGSGSGLPAIPLAITLPQSSITAVESKSRKTQFLHHIKDQLGLENLTIKTQDIHDLIREKSQHPTVVTAKAFKPYDQVLKLIHKFTSTPKGFIPISQTQYHCIQQLNLPIKCLDKTPFYYLTTLDDAINEPRRSD